MEDLIERLQQTYGIHPYAALTEHQRAFLLSPGIMNRAASTDSIYRLENIITGEDQPPVLVMLDLHTYLFHKSSVGGNRSYARLRIPALRRLLQSGDPLNLHDTTYRFTLPDQSLVDVTFLSYKDSS
ncbi:hypothetical protein HZB02_03655 [Candidatus Woesearchaeota archaeon]|nr:hypothetical protein [Candidatus Woesearchaeota archaeon]